MAPPERLIVTRIEKRRKARTLPRPHEILVFLWFSVNFILNLKYNVMCEAGFEPAIGLRGNRLKATSVHNDIRK